MKSVVFLQLEPCFKNPVQSREKANTLLDKITTQADVILLPEMAFTGYTFHSRKDIEPFVETLNGISITWAKEIAVKWKAFVQIGFPRVSDDNIYYNSIAFVSPQGSLIDVYDKHFLFMTDENWAMEGSGFKSIPVPSLGTIGFGICMDINPKQFKAPFDSFEFAHFHLQHHSDILFLSMAWLASGNGDSMSLIRYWLARLQPLIMNPSRSVKVFICNRVGRENDTVFAGTSCVLEVGFGNARLLGHLQAEEGILQCSLPNL
jgi:protein N-terminal amidase